MSRFKTRLVVGLASVGLSVGVLAAASLVAPTHSVLSPPTAAAAAKAKPAKHRRGIQAAVWVGTWTIHTSHGDRPGVCFQPNLGHPTTTGTSTLNGKIPGMSARQSADVKYAVNRYGATNSNTTAAGLNLYVWKVQDQPSFRRTFSRLIHTPKLRGAVRAMNAIAKEAGNHGAYKVTGSVQSGHYGQTVHGQFTFRNAHGKPAVGKKVTLSTSGLQLATLHRSTLTNSHGQVPFTGKVTTIGEYRIDALLEGATSKAVLISHPTRGHQKLAIWVPNKETAHGSTHNHGVTAPASIVATCGTNCHGQAPVTVTKKNECGGAPQRLFTYVNGRVKFTVDVAACATAKRTFTGDDNDRVIAKVCYLDHVGGTCQTAQVTVGTYTVVCPPWPKVTITTVCDCDKASSRVTFTGPAGTRGYKGTVNVNGHTQTVTVANNGSATVDLGTITTRTTIRTSFTAYTDHSYKTVLKSATLGLPVTIG